MMQGFNMNGLGNQPNAKEQKVNVSEIRDKVFFDLIDYAGNAKNGEINYHPEFSPNNIKRVIISPDKVRVYYYVSAGKGTERLPKTSARSTQISAERLYRLAQQPDYVPLVSILSKPLVSASIQEIVFCMNSMNFPQCALTPRELEFNCLVKSYANKQVDLMESLKSRYKRLGHITCFNGTIDELMAIIERTQVKRPFFADVEEIKQRSKVYDFNVDTWFDNWGQNAADKFGQNGYQLDNNGSPLNQYFKRIQDKYKNSKVNDKFEQYKKEKAKVSADSVEKYERALAKYKSYVKANYTLAKLLQENGNSLYSNPNQLLSILADSKVQLEEVSGISHTESDKKLGITYIDNKYDLVGESKIQANITKLNIAAQQLYENCTEILFDNILEQAQIYGSEMFTVVLHEFDNVIAITPKLRVKAERVQSKCKNIFEGTRMRDSMANVCYLFSLLYLSKRTDKDVSEYLSKDYWYDKLA